jgi:hypothetical protein
MRLAPDLIAPAPSHDDLLALADAVREAARPRPEEVLNEPGGPMAPAEVGRRGHLRVLKDPLP